MSNQELMKQASCSSVQIVEVKSKSQLRKFTDYPNQLYKDVPQHVPAFYGDDLADWNPKKNPAFSYCEAKAFLAYRDGEIVGRIGAIYSKRANEIWGTNRMRFSQVDFIDDIEVSSKLFEAVENWADEKGCNQVHGPLGFSDMDREGMLVEGFDHRSMFITYYNHPYYPEHLEKLGYVKDVDWIEHKIPVPQKGSDFYNRIGRLTELALKRGNYHVVDLKRKSQMKPYVRKVFELLNETYAVLYSVVDLNEEQIVRYTKKFLPLVNKEYCCLIVDENDDLVAFGVAAPSMAAALKRSRGRLFPFGWIGILRALRKNTVLDLLLMAVKPELRKSGLNAVVLNHVMHSSIENGIQFAESGPQLEQNVYMHGQWKMIETEQHKRRRAFVKNIKEIAPEDEFHWTMKKH